MKKEASVTYKVRQIPETFIIDKTGKIVKKTKGAEVWDSAANVAFIKHLIEKKSE